MRSPMALVRGSLLRKSLRPFALLMSVLIASVSIMMGSMVPAAAESTPAALNCNPITNATPASASSSAPASIPGFSVPSGATKITIGYMPLSIYAPIYVAYEKGYYAQQGLDVQLTSFTNGTDMTVAVATGKLDIALTGVGPAYWNAVNQGLPLKIIAPGHSEGSPVASPLMISKKSCEDGSIKSVADLKGKNVAVNAPGATELWLEKALETAGLTIKDVHLKYLTFPDAVTALDSGALDAAIVGEPVATQAEQNGQAVRLLPTFPVQGIWPTMVFGNENWLQKNPDAATGFVKAYLRAANDLTTNFNDLVNLAIITKYTKIPSDLVAASVKPVYSTDGKIDINSLNELQTFFGGRGLLDYTMPIDPTTMIDTQYVDKATAGN